MTAIHFIKYSTRKTLTPSKVCTCFGLGVVLWSCRHWVEASALKCLPNSFAGPHRSNEAASARICPGVRGGPARPSAQRPGRRFALAAQAARSASRRMQGAVPRPLGRCGRCQVLRETPVALPGKTEEEVNAQMSTRACASTRVQAFGHCPLVPGKSFIMDTSFLT